ncbi:MAG TPA: ABC transporter ATP-binding protein [Desulfobacterales bacterium]|jgi:branched-chain amino acid transport system ATP-binding protein|nr:ABC transporter ATP-binding protein [Desulfobacterales bacterium]
MLEVQDVNTYYGKIHALKNVSIHVEKGEIVTIIGANGAGKSTMLKTTSGLLKPRSGVVRLEGEDLTPLRAHEIVVKGIVQVPEGRRVFGRLTVKENLEMGAFTSTDKQRNQDNIERVFQMFPRLKERSKQVSGTLSGGEQQMLAMGRALMANPRVLLLDEPSMGLAPVLVDGIFDTIRKLHAAGTTILLVEQNARMALQVASRGYVLQSGAIIISDSAASLADNEMVRKAYLGEH